MPNLPWRKYWLDRKNVFGEAPNTPPEAGVLPKRQHRRFFVALFISVISTERDQTPNFSGEWET
jgi:hypothetical protein